MIQRVGIAEQAGSRGAEFRVLGPVEARLAGRVVRLSRRHERGLLAVLLLEAGRAVPVPRLADLLWGDRQPKDVRAIIHTYVSRMRAALSGTGTDAAGVEVVRHDGGYLIAAGRDSVDAHRFADLTTSARSLRDAGARAARLRQALDLWRGPALANVGEPLRTALGERLEQSRQSALEARIQADLEAGATDELVGELTELTAVHPLSERLAGLLMRALTRTGRRADALAAYRRFRDRTVEELGIEPGHELQQLHRRILDSDEEPIPAVRGARGERVSADRQADAQEDEEIVAEPEAEVGKPQQPAVSQERTTPRELPAVASCFVGRDAELGRVREVLAQSGQLGRPALMVLYGPGGVGKSALAVRAAHDLAAEFPDGQLYVDLFGSTPGMRRLPAVEALGRCLRGLGVRPGEIPAGEVEAAALFRSVTVDRRVLVVLDNAADRAQVAPLVPSGPDCSVLVTCRQPLGTLDADDRLRVKPLPDVSALELIAGLTPGRVIPSDARQAIVSYTGGLPLAIRIAAGRLASRPDLSADEYATRLADRSRRLDELQLDELAVRASIRTGYEALVASDDPTGLPASRAFRALGLLHVADVAPWLVASMLAEPDVESVRAALDRLVDVQLVEPVPDGRYRLHDLVRLVATEYAVTEDSPENNQQALHRAIAYYNGAMWRVNAIRRPRHQPPFGLPPTPDGVVLPDITTRDQARILVESELGNAVEALLQAVEVASCPSLTLIWLSDMIWTNLDYRCDWSTAYRVSRLVVNAAARNGGLELRAWGHMLHGRSQACLGRYDSAEVDLERALAILRGLGNDVGVALALNGIGIVRATCGQPEQALERYTEAFGLVDGTAHGIAATLLSNMCVSYAMSGKLEEASKAAEAAAASDDHTVYISAMVNMSSVQLLAGDYADAIRGLSVAIAEAVRAGDRRQACEALITRSEAYLRLARLEIAAADAERALLDALGWGYPYATAAAHGQLARILAAMGRTTEAAQARNLAEIARANLSGTYRDQMIDLVLAADDSPTVPEPRTAVAG